MSDPDQPAADASSVPRLLRPSIWLMALLWLGMQQLAHGFAHFLDAYERGASAAGRAVVHAARAALHALGPLGRALRWRLDPLLRVIHRGWALLNVYVLRRMFRPMSRSARWVLAHSRPAAAWAARAARWLLRLAEPAVHALATWTAGVEKAAAAHRGLAASGLGAGGRRRPHRPEHSKVLVLDPLPSGAPAVNPARHAHRPLPVPDRPLPGR